MRRMLIGGCSAVGDDAARLLHKNRFLRPTPKHRSHSTIGRRRRDSRSRILWQRWRQHYTGHLFDDVGGVAGAALGDLLPERGVDVARWSAVGELGLAAFFFFLLGVGVSADVDAAVGDSAFCFLALTGVPSLATPCFALRNKPDICTRVHAHAGTQPGVQICTMYNTWSHAPAWSALLPTRLCRPPPMPTPMPQPQLQLPHASAV